MKKTIDNLMEHAEESLKEYSKKTDWTPQDLECAYKAACFYDKLQTISMNMGIWDQMNDENGENSNRAYPMTNRRSFARGRDSVTGRYVSRGHYPDDRMYYDDRFDDSYDEYGGSRNTGGRMSRGDRSYTNNDGRSMHSVNDRMVQKLESMINDGMSDYERDAIIDTIKHIEGKN